MATMLAAATVLIVLLTASPAVLGLEVVPEVPSSCEATGASETINGVTVQLLSCALGPDASRYPEACAVLMPDYNEQQLIDYTGRLKDVNTLSCSDHTEQVDIPDGALDTLDAWSSCMDRCLEQNTTWHCRSVTVLHVGNTLANQCRLSSCHGPYSAEYLSGAVDPPATSFATLQKYPVHRSFWLANEAACRAARIAGGGSPPTASPTPQPTFASGAEAGLLASHFAPGYLGRYHGDAGKLAETPGLTLAECAEECLQSTLCAAISYDHATFRCASYLAWDEAALVASGNVNTYVRNSATAAPVAPTQSPTTREPTPKPTLRPTVPGATREPTASPTPQPATAKPTAMPTDLATASNKTSVAGAAATNAAGSAMPTGTAVFVAAMVSALALGLCLIAARALAPELLPWA